MSLEQYHKISPANSHYVTIVLPIAVPKLYTYFVPEELVASIQFGIRVEVQLGKSKLYSGLVIDIHQNVPEDYTVSYTHLTLPTKA